MSENTALAVKDGQTSIMERGTMSPAAVVAQVEKVQEVMHKLMRPGEHYGTIPGTDKPTLLKAGAEKLSFTFRLLPKYRITARDLPNGHREYEIICELWHESNVFAGEGVGNCSTMESKYRYRNIADFEDTGEPIPADSKERKAEYRKQGFGMKKVSGVWAWVKYKDSARQENPDIADTYNTVLKMAKKRALVDATITACAASDIFTQDVGDAETEEDSRGNGDAVDTTFTEKPTKQDRVAALKADPALLTEEKKQIIAQLNGAASADEQEKILAGWEKEARERSGVPA